MNDHHLAEPPQRYTDCASESTRLAFVRNERGRRQCDRRISDIRSDTEALIELMQTAGQLLLRVQAVLKLGVA